MEPQIERDDRYGKGCEVLTSYHLGVCSLLFKRNNEVVFKVPMESGDSFMSFCERCLSIAKDNLIDLANAEASDQIYDEVMQYFRKKVLEGSYKHTKT